KSVCMNVISKSGTTLETALTFRILRNWFDRSYGDSAPERIFVTTAPSGGVLNDMAGLFGYEKFVIPDDIGGRFSVLTPVGLLPASVAGIDIRLLIEGAVTQFRTCETRADEITEYAALRYYFQKNGKKLDVIGSFEPGLQSLTGWLQQLLGESEGKEGKGLFPVPAAYSTDLHSIGQMIQQGPRNMIETLLAVEEPLSDLTVSEEAQDTDGLGYLSGRLLYDINRQALNGTVEAHAGGGVPVFLIGIRSLDARNLGGLIYFYQLFTAVYVSMLGVNPFDQPGVEDYKKAMYRNLGA
ncbi:MAG: glucose-6-phosphate isomerase, partial [Balneolaceae bacterium]